VASILEAATEVIDDVGWSRASTNRIAERAGVSIGSLYQYFPNKEAILAGLFEKHHFEVDEIVGESLVLLGDASVPLAEVLRKLFRDLIEMHRREPVLTRVLSTEVPVRPTDDDRGSGHDHGALVSLLRMRPDVRESDLHTIARILEITVEALTRWLVHEAPEDADVDVFVERSVAMLCGLLTGAPAEV
jgi:AcrR family transcriptional regulator